VYNNWEAQFCGEFNEVEEGVPLIVALSRILYPVIVKSHLPNPHNPIGMLPYERDALAHHMRACPWRVKPQCHPHKTGESFHQGNRPWIELWFNGADHNANNPGSLCPFYDLRSRGEKRWHLKMAVGIEEFHGRFLGAVAWARKVEKVSALPAS
jgi:hypothetical protein